MTNALQQLIQVHCEDTGDTLASIARRAGLSRQTVSAVVHRSGPGGIPRKATLTKLATGLELPVHVVVAAASQAATDMPATKTDQRLASLIEHAARLDDEKLHALLITARALSGVK